MITMFRYKIIQFIVVSVCLMSFNVPLAHAYEVRISPTIIHTRDTAGMKILCEAKDGDVPVALVGCQFMLQAIRLDGPVQRSFLEFSRGSASEIQDGFMYSGTGLQRGQCGMTLRTYTDDGNVGCRVREAGGRWQYKKLLIQYSYYTSINYTFEPSEVMVLPGDSVNFTGITDRVINHCYINVPGDTRALEITPEETSDQTGKYRYYGLGLDKMHCGLTILNVTTKNNGFICTWAAQERIRLQARRCSTLIVLTPPDKPRLTVTSTDLMEGKMLLNATCVISNSRPVSNITWLLGDKVIREDLTNEGPAEAEWLWSYDPQNITQHLLRHVTQEDNDKQLVCRASHVALQSGRIDSSPYVIKIKHKPVFATSPAGELEGIEGKPLSDLFLTFANKPVFATSPAGELEGIEDKPVFATSPERELEGIEGKPLMIPVKATGNPLQITYRWTKDGLENVTVSEEPHLSFSQLGMYDAGVYTCTADNALGSTSVNIHITVKKDRTPYLMTEVLVPLLLVASAATLLWLKKLWCFAGGRDVDNYRMRLPLHTSDEE